MSIRILAREPSSTVIEEKEGRLFYVLFTYLQTRAYELFLTEKVKERYPKWSFRSHENPLDLRNLVSRTVFDEFENLCVELYDMPTQDKIKLKIISSGLLMGGAFDTFSSTHIEQIYKWGEIRVEAHFWYIGCCNEGGVFAYLGSSEEDECIFIVKALSTNYSQLLQFRTKSHPDLPYSCFETVLLPWKDKIIYHGVLTPYLHYTTKQTEEYHERIKDIIARCESKGKIRKSLTIEDTIKVERNKIFDGVNRSNFMAEPIKQSQSTTSTDFQVTYISWSPFKNPFEHQISKDELQTIINAGESAGYKSQILYSEIVDCGENCRLCDKGIYGSCGCKEKHELLMKKSHELLMKKSGAALQYCVDGVNCEEATTISPPNRLKKMSLVDFYMFEFTVSNNDLLEIKARLEECTLFICPDRVSNISEEKSAFFHYVGPIVMQFRENSSSIMTFASIELFADNRIEIHSNSLARAKNMLGVLRYVILGEDYGNSEKIVVTNMMIEVSLLSSMKDRNRVKDEASELAKKFEEFIGTVNVKIDKMTFDYRACSYCGSGNRADHKLLVCSACTGTKKAHYCNRDCQKKHWKYHKEKAGH